MQIIHLLHCSCCHCGPGTQTWLQQHQTWRTSTLYSVSTCTPYWIVIWNPMCIMIVVGGSHYSLYGIYIHMYIYCLCVSLFTCVCVHMHVHTLCMGIHVHVCTVLSLGSLPFYLFAMQCANSTLFSCVYMHTHIQWWRLFLISILCCRGWSLSWEPSDMRTCSGSSPMVSDIPAPCEWVVVVTAALCARSMDIHCMCICRVCWVSVYILCSFINWRWCMCKWYSSSQCACTCTYTCVKCTIIQHLRGSVRLFWTTWLMSRELPLAKYSSHNLRAIFSLLSINSSMYGFSQRNPEWVSYAHDETQRIALERQCNTMQHNTIQLNTTKQNKSTQPTQLNETKQNSTT